MATNKKNEFPIINNEKLNIALSAFVSSERLLGAGC